jgi:SPOR domain
MSRWMSGAALLIGLVLPAAAMSPMDQVGGGVLEATASSKVPAGTRLASRQSPETSTPLRQWSVQLAGSFSREQALASFAGIRSRHRAIVGDAAPVVLDMPYGNRGPGAFYRVRLPSPSRMAAVELCGRLRSAGGSCVVLSTP